MSHLALLSLSLAGSGMVHRVAESRTVRPARRRRLRHRAGDAPHHTPCRFGPERKVVAGPARCGTRTRDRGGRGGHWEAKGDIVWEAEGDIVNCESVPGKTGSLSVSSYSSHSMMAIHYVPLAPLIPLSSGRTR